MGFGRHIVFVVVVIMLMIAGCVSPKYGYWRMRTQEYADKYMIYVNSPAFSAYIDSSNYKTCYKRNKCFNEMSFFAKKVVEEQLQPAGKCIKGYKVLEDSILFDENAVGTITILCE